MDFSNIKPRESAAKGAWLTVLHPITEEETDCRIQVMGADSPEAERFWATAEKANEGKTIGFMRRKQMGVEFLASLTLDWEGMQEDGKDVPFNEENAIRMYKTHQWLREQVDAFAAKRGNFIKTS